MPVTEMEKAQIPVRYTNNPRIVFGKILERYLKGAQSQYGFFQNALTLAIPEFFMRVFSYRMKYGFAMNGVCTIPGTPPVPVPVVGAPGGPAGTTACITAFTPAPLTYAQVDAACKDKTIGFWGRIFELMGNYMANTTIVITNPMAMGFTYTTSMRAIYPALPQQWLAAGQAFGQRMINKGVDDHDYFMMMWSEELERQIKMLVGAVPLPAYPVIGAIFSGNITATWADFNTLI